MSKVDYSIVVPVYNSAGMLQELTERLGKVLGTLGKTYQIIFVDDGSPDNSWEAISDIKKANPDLIKAIRLSMNFGQQNATLCGITQSDGDFIITIDDDLQIPPEEITKLIQIQKDINADLVYGIFDLKKHGVIRNMGSRFVNKFFKWFANTSGQGTSFRLLTRPLAQKISDVNQKYLLLDEVLNWFTKSIGYVKVKHLPRSEGKSGYSIFKLIALTLSYTIYYTIIPLRLMTYVGFLISLITFVIGVIYIYRRLFMEVELGFTSIVVAIFFSTSITLFSLGIIGEYISRIYIKDASKPPFVIKEML